MGYLRHSRRLSMPPKPAEPSDIGRSFRDAGKLDKTRLPISTNVGVLRELANLRWIRPGQPSHAYEPGVRILTPTVADKRPCEHENSGARRSGLSASAGTLTK